MREDIQALLSLVRAGLDVSAAPGPSAGEIGSRNWAFINATAARHRLSGLLFEGIQRLGIESVVPTRILESLRSAYYRNLTYNLVMFDHAEALIEQAQRQGRRLVLLKGAAFAHWLYAHPALRPMGDLDILVLSGDLDFFLGLAEELGYRELERTDHAVALRHMDSATYLELHTSLASCPGYLQVDTEAMVARSIPTTQWEEPARMLTPEDNLLHLCLHASFQHGLRQPAVNACDAHLISQLREFQWETFIERASSARLAPLVYGGLSLCHRVMPGERLRKALDSLEPRVQSRCRKRVGNLDLGQLLSPSSDSVAGSPWNRLLWAPSLMDRLKMVRETLRTRDDQRHPSDWQVIHRGLRIANRHLFPRSKAFARMRYGVRW